MEAEELINAGKLAQRLNKFNSPFTIKVHQVIKNWNLDKLTPEKLPILLDKRPITFRLGKKRSKGVQWETNCEYVTATTLHFLEWIETAASDVPAKRSKSTNKLLAFSPTEYWCYADYKYMNELFESSPEILQDIKWSDFGFIGKTGIDSTFWFGSKGAYTVCHYDTYGYNLVIQVSGKKRWIMFPPSDSDCLYPTRIPYEESSVFSSVDIQQPDLTKHPRFQNATPHIVELVQGDMLFVPHHWWHYVENLETSTSINMWIPAKEDNFTRVEESVVRYLVASMLDKSQVAESINPTEDMDAVLCQDQAIEFINQSLNEINNSETNANNINVAVNNCQLSINKIKPCSMQQCVDVMPTWNFKPKNKPQQSRNKLSKNDILRAMTHPDVISVISKKLVEL